MAAPEIELLQFPRSHFNEKVRWALDFKQIPHRRINFLPGPHSPQIRRKTGQTAVPVLHIDGRYVPGSAEIIALLERRYPDPALYPADAELREQALAIQARFDREVGPKGRQAMFANMIDDGAYVARMFSEQRSLPVRIFYRTMFAVAQKMMRRAMELDDKAAVAAAETLITHAMDDVAVQVAGTGYMVGARFTVADLTVAAILAPIANPPGSPMERPEPKPEKLTRWLAKWEDHPALHWVHGIYRRHRPPSAATETVG